MRLLTVQIDLDALGEARHGEAKAALKRAGDTMILHGIPVADGICRTLQGEQGQHIGYWSIQPKKIGE